MTCAASLRCGCGRCTRLRRHAYREGLADAHRVLQRGPLTLRLPSLSPRVLARLQPALLELEWSGTKELIGGIVKQPACPECGALERTREHDPGCTLWDAIAQARVASVQPDLFEVGR